MTERLTMTTRPDRPLRIERPYRVRFDESTPDDTVRTSVYLGWLADCAWQHSTTLGFDRAWYDERHIGWLVRAMRLELLRPLPPYSEVGVSTEVLGFGRATARRLSEVRRDGELVARAEIDWLMVNERGLPVRLPAGFDAVFSDRPAAFQVRRVEPGQPPADAFEWRLVVARRDLDPLDHVNNGVYLDYLEDALVAAGRADLLRTVPRRYTLEYAGAAVSGERLVGLVWPDASGWSYRLSREGGGDLFRARLEL